MQLEKQKYQIRCHSPKSNYSAENLLNSSDSGNHLQLTQILPSVLWEEESSVKKLIILNHYIPLSLLRISIVLYESQELRIAQELHFHSCDLPHTINPWIKTKFQGFVCQLGQQVQKPFLESQNGTIKLIERLADVEPRQTGECIHFQMVLSGSRSRKV